MPVVSNDPVVQRTIERQLAPAQLDPYARVGNLDFRDTPLKEIIDSVAMGALRGRASERAF